MHVFLTGATGFIGSQVARELIARGHRVTALLRPRADRRRLGDIAERLEPLVGDLDRPESWRAELERRAPEACLHLAWYVAHGDFWTAPANLDGVVQSLNLARALEAAGCRRLVAAGSCAEYGGAEPRPREGLTPCRPETIYGAAKLAVYTVLERYAAQRGLSFAWLRYGFSYGPHEPPARLVPEVMRALLAGRDADCTHGRQQRDFLHVSDTAAASVAVLESHLAGAVNIGSGQARSLREVVERIAALVGGPGRVRLGARAAPPGEPEVLLPDVGRLRDELGWRARLDLDEGLRQTLAFWRAQKGS